MSTKKIYVNDISYLQNHLVGLPFIIVDDSAFLPSLLHDEVSRRCAGTHTQQMEIMRYFQQYVMDVNNAHASIARQYDRSVFDVKLTYFLLAPEVENDVLIQKFVAQLVVNLDDCVAKFTQRFLKLAVCDKGDKWKEIVLHDAPQVGAVREDRKATPGAFTMDSPMFSQ